jgi:hypothetical protein
MRNQSQTEQENINLQDVDGKSQVWRGFSNILLVNSYVSPQKASNIHAIYHFIRYGIVLHGKGQIWLANPQLEVV